MHSRSPLFVVHVITYVARVRVSPWDSVYVFRCFDLHSTCHALCYVWFRSQVEAENHCAKIMWLNVSGLAASLRGNKCTPNDKVQGPGINICYNQNGKIKLKVKNCNKSKKRSCYSLLKFATICLLRWKVMWYFILLRWSVKAAPLAFLTVRTCNSVKHIFRNSFFNKGALKIIHRMNECCCFV